jgi:hypothetical protein
LTALAFAAPYNNWLAPRYGVTRGQHQKQLRLALIQVQVEADAMAQEKTLNHLREE